MITQVVSDRVWLTVTVFILADSSQSKQKQAKETDVSVFLPWSPAGLCVDGLYRVSGNLAVIQKLRFAVNHGKLLLSGTASHHYLGENNIGNNMKRRKGYLEESRKLS